MHKIIHRVGYTLTLAALTALLVTHSNGQQGAAKGAAKGAPKGPPPVPLGVTPKAAIANAKPVRTCESLAQVSMPNTTIESAVVDEIGRAHV